MKIPVKFEENNATLKVDFEAGAGKYDEGYNKGHSEGYEEGSAEGYPNGYADGKADGITEGYTNGKSDGITEGYESGKADGKTEGYNEGYPKGYEVGKADGTTEGYNNGYEVGKTDGITEGFKEGEAQGRAEGIEEGKKSEYDRFWEDHLRKTKEGDFAYCGGGWDDETFNPPYGTVIQPTNARYMFAHSHITDLVALCEKKRITLDFSKSTTTHYLFYESHITRLGVIDTRGTTTVSYPFYGQSKLHTIVKLILKDDGSQKFNPPFSSCSSLENMEIEGVIGQNGFDVSPCKKLTYKSLTSIKNALADKSTDTSGTVWIITVGSENKAKYTEDDKYEILQKGWDLR